MKRLGGDVLERPWGDVLVHFRGSGFREPKRVREMGARSEAHESDIGGDGGGLECHQN